MPQDGQNEAEERVASLRVPGTSDKYGQEVPDRVYNQKDYDRELVIEDRNLLVARKVTEFLKQDGHSEAVIQRLVFETANAFYSHSPKWKPELNLTPVDPREFQR